MNWCCVPDRGHNRVVLVVLRMCVQCVDGVIFLHIIIHVRALSI